MKRILWVTLAFPLAVLGYADFAAGQTLSKTGKVTSAGPDFGSTTQAQNGESIRYVIQYSNPGGLAAMLDLKDPIPAGTAYLAGSLQVPTQFSKQWSTDGGATWLTAEPVSELTSDRRRAGQGHVRAGRSDASHLRAAYRRNGIQQGQSRGLHPTSSTSSRRCTW
jgi:uncharacterized repeat protein (TIGR01451 family)